MSTRILVECVCDRCARAEISHQFSAPPVAVDNAMDPLPGWAILRLNRIDGGA